MAKIAQMIEAARTFPRDRLLATAGAVIATYGIGVMRDAAAMARDTAEAAAAELDGARWAAREAVKRATEAGASFLFDPEGEEILRRAGVPAEMPHEDGDQAQAAAAAGDG